MKIHIITIGTKMPKWVTQGYDEYAKRLPRECQLVLHELPLANRGKSLSKADVEKIKQQEAVAIKNKLPKNTYVVALDERGKPWTTLQMADEMTAWMSGGQDVALLIGGPDGLSPELKESAAKLWSLSPLTLPHPIVRVLLAEQLYRAWSVTQNHPYHRE